MNLMEVGCLGGLGKQQVQPKQPACLGQGDRVPPVKHEGGPCDDLTAAFGSREVIHQISLQPVVGCWSYTLHLSRRRELLASSPAVCTLLLVHEVHDCQRGPREVNEVVWAMLGEVIPTHRIETYEELLLRHFAAELEHESCARWRQGLIAVAGGHGQSFCFSVSSG